MHALRGFASVGFGRAKRSSRRSRRIGRCGLGGRCGPGGRFGEGAGRLRLKLERLRDLRDRRGLGVGDSVLRPRDPVCHGEQAAGRRSASAASFAVSVAIDELSAASVSFSRSAFDDVSPKPVPCVAESSRTSSLSLEECSAPSSLASALASPKVSMNPGSLAET